MTETGLDYGMDRAMVGKDDQRQTVSGDTHMAKAERKAARPTSGGAPGSETEGRLERVSLGHLETPAGASGARALSAGTKGQG